MIDSKQIWQNIEPIARQHFDVETLETRNSDRLDFHDVAIWNIRDALVAAYMAGHREGAEKGFKEAAGIEDNE